MCQQTVLCTPLGPAELPAHKCSCDQETLYCLVELTPGERLVVGAALTIASRLRRFLWLSVQARHQRLPSPASQSS